MIKTRLIRLLSHAKKYIVYQVLWQWIALVSQIVAIFQVAGLLKRAADGSITSKDMGISLLVFGAVIVLRFMGEKMAAKASYMASVDVKRILRDKIYDKICN